MPDLYYYDSINPESIVEFLETNAEFFITSLGNNLITSDGDTFVVGSNTIPGVIASPGILIDQRSGITDTVNAATGVRINLSSAKPVQFLALYAGSVTTAPTITVSGSSLDTSGYTQFHTTSSVSAGWNIYEFSSTQTYQYYSIQFNSSSNFTIGEIILGTKFEPSRNPDIGEQIKTEPINTISESYSGHQYSNKIEDPKTLYIQQYKAIGNTEKQNFESMRDATKDKRILYNPGTIKYVIIDQNALSFTEVAHQLWDTNITLTEN